ncbi:MAG: hypothetical protein P8J45_07525 [Phycisphaerales bacterium]|nr:hypothetical protein [Phycisphaerales bacterium]
MTATAVDVYCKRCFYPLLNLDTNVCPECGRPFDPGKASTTSPYPVGSIRRKVGKFACFLSLCLAFVAALFFFHSALGFDPMIIFLVAFAMIPVALIMLLLLALPPLPIDWRFRILGVMSLACIVSIVFTSWPLRLNFLLHRSALERQVAKIRSEGLPTGNTARRVGLLNFVAVKERQGNIGFQLTGGGGGGTFLVLDRKKTRWVWDNTNWEKRFDDNWVYVEQD